MDYFTDWCQRLIGRTRLKKLFDGVEKNNTSRDRLIAESTYGYSQVEVARHLGLHYSTADQEYCKRARVKI
jgi:hypothetical protein